MSWGPINPQFVAGNLPAVRLHEEPDATWCAVQFSLDGMSASPRDVLHAIAARDDSQHTHRVPEGLRFVYRLSQAVGVDIAGVDYEELPRLLIGKRLELTWRFPDATECRNSSFGRCGHCLLRHDRCSPSSRRGSGTTAGVR
jgi:hypothetical protein